MKAQAQGRQKICEESNENTCVYRRISRKNVRSSLFPTQVLTWSGSKGMSQPNSMGTPKVWLFSEAKVERLISFQRMKVNFNEIGRACV